MHIKIRGLGMIREKIGKRIKEFMLDFFFGIFCQ